ncbi:hypothetical protein [Hymenobacter properus]|uniref:Uncharacterized protein n=1 Tax=Hymenobacter properus TaxID=2791026 RepID=A0A931FHA7_9BACT|nr:hypothetical protein [Hymenobacter properus]MBF9140862.1 hypothetical protein [Hymenobacter properus]MBR7719671.1 hypothetical protein [Microvirga sp. SRT04]
MKNLWNRLRQWVRDLLKAGRSASHYPYPLLDEEDMQNFEEGLASEQREEERG